MSAAGLVTLARARGLYATAALLDGFQQPQLLDATRLLADPRVTEPPHTLPKRILGQMARRGLDPSLVRAIWTWLDGRPLERALLAVDVLARSLLAPGEPIAVELRAAAAT